MKNISLLLLLLTSFYFLSCSRDDPNPLKPPTPTVEKKVIVNEIFSRGTATNPDWVEVYNVTNTAVDISNYKIYDDGGQSGSKPKKPFPAGTIVPAKGFFVIIVDDTTASGFGLSANGEKIWLEDEAGNIINEINIPALGVDTSYGRLPDGSNLFDKLTPPTPGTTNGENPNPTVKIVMNEIFAKGVATDPDWIEIYNDSNVEIDLTGFKIYDNGGQSGSKPKMEFPAGAKIPAKGFYVIVVDDGSASGFGLSQNGETVWFENGSGTVIDQVAFPAVGSFQTYARIPDGSDNWQNSNTMTKGGPNQP